MTGDPAEFFRQQDEAAAKTGVGNGADPAWLTPVPAAQPGEGGRPIEAVRFADMQARLDDRTVVAGLLSSGELGLVVGATGTGKSFFVIDMSLHTASGRQWFGRRTQQGGVLYIASEAGKGIINRIVAYKMHFSGMPEDLPFTAIISPVDLHDQQADISKIIALIKTLGYEVKLIIVDTLSRAMAGGDENSPEGMGSFVQNMDELRHRTGAHVLVVHHLGKDTNRGARGHSLLSAAVDTEIEITRDEGSKISTARVTKQRELALNGNFCFTLKSFELGRNQYNEPVTSCILEPAEPPPANKRGKKLSAAESVALRLLGEAIATAAEPAPANNHIPTRARCVKEDLWRQYCYQGGISSSDKSDSQLKAFNRAAEGLVAGGQVGKWAPWVWLL